jgi:hypothetical protein
MIDVTTFSMLVFGVSLFTFIMLLPALLELKRPKDAGPRIIMENAAISDFHVRITALERTEEKTVLEPTILKKMVDIIAMLLNIET